MSVQINQEAVNVHFDRLTDAFGINQAGRIHRALLAGDVTPGVRRVVRNYLVSEGRHRPS